MSIITLPAGLPLGLDCEMGVVRTDAVDASDPSGIEQARVYGPPRWTMLLASPQHLRVTDAEAWATIITRLAGHTGVLAAPAVPRIEPRGTMRGSMTLAAGIAAGAESAQIVAAGQPGATLLDGDWLQIGAGLGASQLIRVVGDAVSDGAGVISIAFVHPARAAYAAGTVVTWQRPMGYWRRSSAEARWTWMSSQIGRRQQLDLVEAFR